MKSLIKNPFAIAFLIGVISLPLLRYIQTFSYTAPAPLMIVGDWELTDANHQPFSKADLKGKVWVANFFFSRCPTVCVELMSNMKKVSTSFEDLGDAVSFVSFTVDPEHDQPDALTAYRKKIGATDPRWHFLTGDSAHVESTIMKTLKFPMEKEPTSVMQVAHTGKLALYDQNGDLRALFSTDPKSLGALGNAARMLVKKGPNP